MQRQRWFCISLITLLVSHRQQVENITPIRILHVKQFQNKFKQKIIRKQYSVSEIELSEVRDNFPEQHSQYLILSKNNKTRLASSVIFSNISLNVEMDSF